MPVVLMGLKHCGKTSVGKLLGSRLGIPFFDADDLLTERYRRDFPKSGSTAVPAIYRELGKAGFDRLQLETLTDFFSASAGSRFVLALGGGCADLDGLEELLRDSDCFLLRERIGLLYERIRRKGCPPAFLAGSGDPLERFRLLAEARLERYQSWAGYTVECAGRPVLSIAEEIEQRIANRYR